MAYTRKSVEERVAIIDNKIDTCKRKIESEQHKIDELLLKKTRILNPQPRKRKTSATAIINKAKEAGMTEAEIAERLGIEL